jgi:hypothetical protein
MHSKSGIAIFAVSTSTTICRKDGKEIERIPEIVPERVPDTKTVGEVITSPTTLRHATRPHFTLAIFKLSTTRQVSHSTLLETTITILANNKIQHNADAP